ncbi:uncharacterized protein LOC130137860 [Syzygium oleosum]|uniref:uncharacterized protein LOC130137860 n=1 Tax=Syzygium oleosum TaxID=219896 RepID=UPI0024BB4CC1|nr:uncharacterized protein LOC130137860 [Syzygium oleosum]
MGARAVENPRVDIGAAVDPRVEVRPVEDPRMEVIMRTLERIENLLEQQTQERAAPIAQVAEAAEAAVVANDDEHQGYPEAAPRWVEELEKAFEVLECNDHERVTLAVYQLQDNANDWWKATKDRIFPEASARERKLADFMRLHQGQMTVDQYEAEFARLSKFAPRMVEHPEDKARRFLDGLRADIRSQLLLVNLGTYEHIFDRAQILERDQMDRAAASGSRFIQGWNNRNPEKRPMVDNRRFTPLAKRNIEKPIRIGNGPCRICGGRHGNGPCPTRGGACFGCGGFGHHIKNCPNPRQNRSPTLPPPRNENQAGAA